MTSYFCGLYYTTHLTGVDILTKLGTTILTKLTLHDKISSQAFALRVADSRALALSRRTRLRRVSL